MCRRLKIENPQPLLSLTQTAFISFFVVLYHLLLLLFELKNPEIIVIITAQNE